MHWGVILFVLNKRPQSITQWNHSALRSPAGPVWSRLTGSDVTGMSPDGAKPTVTIVFACVCAWVCEVSDQCRVRTVRCKESWRCGLRTTTVSEGQRVELDCLGPVMKVMGRFSWRSGKTCNVCVCVREGGVYRVEGLTSWFLCPRVSWRRAPGVISFDDSLFKRWRAPLLDRLVLDPVREEDSGDRRRQYLQWLRVHIICAH